MASLALLPTVTAPLFIKPPLASTFKYLRTCHRHHFNKNLNQRRKVRDGRCRAELSHDAPIGIAIGACFLSSLVFPVMPDPEDIEGESVIDTADARFAVMGIISFIPYFNWLSWVFAWLDTGKRRYAVYAIVYLAPYLRTNLSLSPEESWLPIASILLCIIHVQLEASIKNGDLQGFQFFGEAAKHLSSLSIRKETRKTEDKSRSHKNLPASEEDRQIDIRKWGVPKESCQDPEHSNEKEADDGWEQ